MKDELIKIRSVEFKFNDIFQVIDAFYKKVARDPELSIPFSSVSDWAHHIEHLTYFWWIRLGGKPYQKVFYSPVEKHLEAGFNDIFLKRWLHLFKITLYEELSPEQADLWYSIADMMGVSLSRNNELMKLHRGAFSSK